MRSSALLTIALAVPSIFAAPTWPKLNIGAANPDGLDILSDYFNKLASKVQAGKLMGFAPICDLSKAQQPAASPALEAPSAGLTLKHVAIGRGTQNYTCDTSNPSAEPTANGALATLFNASCIASTYPDLLHSMPALALQFDLTPSESALSFDTQDTESMRMGPTNLAVSGKHYFKNSTTPFFNLDTAEMALGYESFAKFESSDAPASAPKGRQGEAAVAWLKLKSIQDGSGELQEVYRLETAGGSPPATCEGMPATFEVQYAAEYWFYEGSAP